MGLWLDASRLCQPRGVGDRFAAYMDLSDFACLTFDKHFHERATGQSITSCRRRLLIDEMTVHGHPVEIFNRADVVDSFRFEIFGRECFLNEIVWAYDYGARSKRRWPTKHDTILVYVKDSTGYYYDAEAVDREPYMAPGLVTPEKAARGKLPTDVWWHTIVPTSGREKTGYPTQKPEGIVRRMV
jgi:hypothetical protein